MDIGYNGVSLSKQKSCAEIQKYEYNMAREARPRDFFSPYVDGKGVEFRAYQWNCAPVNWMVRKPNDHFTDNEGYSIAWHPQLSALSPAYKRGIREIADWIHRPTYDEPVFHVN